MPKFIYDGWIEVICGPMFAGKTDELLKRLDKIKYTKENYIIFKPTIDTRSLGKVTSRTKRWEYAVEINDPIEIIKYLENSNIHYKVIAIDEVQFMPINTIDVCLELSKKGYHIITSGLDKNFKAEPFGQTIPGLLAIANSVTKLSAACHKCGAKADYTFLIKNDNNMKNNILIGDSDIYEARCHKHYYEN